MKKRYYHSGNGLIVDYYDELLNKYVEEISKHKGNEEITCQLLKRLLKDLGIEELLKRNNENCRLLGMSAERELKLLSQIDFLKNKTGIICHTKLPS